MYVCTCLGLGIRTSQKGYYFLRKLSETRVTAFSSFLLLILWPAKAQLSLKPSRVKITHSEWCTVYTLVSGNCRYE